MVFRLLDHLDHLEIITSTNSQVTARCPICEAKLVITTKNSAYKCVAGCKPIDIRAKIGFPKSGTYVSKIEAPVVPITLPTNIRLFKTVEKIDIPDSTYISNKHEQRVRRRDYQYTPIHKMIRIDKLVDKKKIFYQLVYDENKWVKPKPEHPVLSTLYCPITFEPDNKFLTFVEGEKNTVDLCNAGIVSITTSCFNWGHERLTYGLKQFHRKISGIIYIPDNDKTGIKKAIDVQTCCWKIGIPCKIINLKKHYTKPKEDVSDLINTGVDIVQIIEEMLRNG